MKLLPTPPRADDVRSKSDESLGHGMDAVITLMIFLAVGWGLDSIFGTLPVFMIVMVVFGAVGVFARFYYSYSRTMDGHDADRLAKLGGRPSTPTASTPSASTPSASTPSASTPSASNPSLPTPGLPTQGPATLESTSNTIEGVE